MASRTARSRRVRTIRSSARGARTPRSAARTTSMAINMRLPFDAEPDAVETVESRIDARDRAGRTRAVDPRFNVALEASAGTGKTRILVERYVNLLKEGV